MKTKVLFILISLIVLFSCNTEDSQPEDFVQLENEKFKLKNENFFPVMINYVICFRKINGEVTISPIQDYDIPDKFEGNSKDSVLNIMEGHIKMIKELGFNSIRLIGLDRMDYIDNSNEIGFQVYKENGKIIKYPFKDHSELLFNNLFDFFEIAEKHDIKIMVLNPRPVRNNKKNNNRLDFIKSMLQEYSNNPTVFSYDFFNEPIYFDNKNFPPGKRKRSKESAYKLVSDWKELMNKHAPNQLFTIGFSEPLEVLEWDPSILPVDFVQVHTYNPLKIPNEMYWYQKYIKKPWMLGETALPADNDSISYEEMEQFVKESYKSTINCGGIGYGYWQYQDVNWGRFGVNHSAFLDHEGRTFTKDDAHFIYGSKKIDPDILFDLRDYKPERKCKWNVNYKNMYGFNNYVIKGQVINEENKEPVEGAVIRGWRKDWTRGHQTFSDSKGNFSLYSNDEFVHFAVSAPGMTKTSFDAYLEYKPVYDHGLTMEELPNKDISIHEISFKSFIKNKDTYFERMRDNEDSVIFSYDKDLFNNAKFEASLKPVKIKELDFIK